MTEATAPVATQTSPPAATPPQIVVVDAERIGSYWTDVGGVIRGALLGGIILSVLLTGQLAFARVGVPLGLPGIVAVAAILTLVIFGMIAMIRMEVRKLREDWQRKRDDHDKADHGEHAHGIEHIVASAMLEIGGLCQCSMWTGRCAESERTRLRDILSQHGFWPDVAIVDSSLLPALEKVDRPKHMLEQESILSAPKGWWSAPTVAVGLLMVVGLYALINAAVDNEWWMIPVFAAGLIGGGVFIGRALGYRFGESRVPIAGMGFIVDQKGRRWTVNDSCMYIRGYRGRLFGGVDVQLVGPDGLLCMWFFGTDDPGFVTLWQRWMHPNPRPELS